MLDKAGRTNHDNHFRDGTKMVSGRVITSLTGLDFSMVGRGSVPPYRCQPVCNLTSLSPSRRTTEKSSVVADSTKQLSHLRLRQPNGFARETDLYRLVAGFKDQDFIHQGSLPQGLKTTTGNSSHQLAAL